MLPIPRVPYICVWRMVDYRAWISCQTRRVMSHSGCSRKDLIYICQKRLDFPSHLSSCASNWACFIPSLLLALGCFLPVARENWTYLANFPFSTWHLYLIPQQSLIVLLITLSPAARDPLHLGLIIQLHLCSPIFLFWQSWFSIRASCKFHLGLVYTHKLFCFY